MFILALPAEDTMSRMLHSDNVSSNIDTRYSEIIQILCVRYRKYPFIYVLQCCHHFMLCGGSYVLFTFVLLLWFFLMYKIRLIILSIFHPAELINDGNLPWTKPCSQKVG